MNNSDLLEKHSDLLDPNVFERLNLKSYDWMRPGMPAILKHGGKYFFTVIKSIIHYGLYVSVRATDVNTNQAITNRFENFIPYNGPCKHCYGTGHNFLDLDAVEQESNPEE